MTEQANVGCTCGGEFVSLDGQSNVYQCQQCGKVQHQIAAKHYDLLQDLTESDDPAVSDLAESVLSFEGVEQ